VAHASVVNNGKVGQRPARTSKVPGLKMKTGKLLIFSRPRWELDPGVFAGW